MRFISYVMDLSPHGISPIQKLKCPPKGAGLATGTHLPFLGQVVYWCEAITTNMRKIYNTFSLYSSCGRPPGRGTPRWRDIHAVYVNGRFRPARPKTHVKQDGKDPKQIGRFCGHETAEYRCGTAIVYMNMGWIDMTLAWPLIGIHAETV